MNFHALASPRHKSIRCARSWLVVPFVFGQFSFAVSASWAEDGDSENQRAAVERLQRIESDYGLTVEYKYDDSKFFPARWLREPISGKGGQIELEQLPRLAKIIETFVSRYPKPVIRANLKQVFLVSELKFYGKSYGATYAGTSVYLKIRNKHGLSADTFLTARLHSEFSSILMRKHKFPKNEWAALNPSDFKYSGTGVEMLGQGGLYGQTKVLLKKGFLVKYSQSSMENDFNMLSDWLFTRRKELVTLCQRYEVLNAKRELAEKFYKSLDVKF
jgi:hypothetical protein